LKAAGPSAYAAHPTTDVSVLCWAINDDPIAAWRPGDPVPPSIADHVTAGGPIVAHNISFERAIWRHILTPRHGWPEPRLEQWECTAALAAAMALPRSLEGAAQALGLPIRKDMAGYRLMVRMARPRRRNSDGSIVWWDDADRLERLIEYCRNDVEVERLLHDRLRPLSAFERRVFLLDAQINSRGINLDFDLIDAAEALADDVKASLDAELRELTGGAVESASQVARMTAWLADQGVAAESIDKRGLKTLLGQENLPANARRVLEIRAEASKSSVAKLTAFRARAGEDKRIRDNLAYHGAATGRWAGRGVQLQNLPRPGKLNGARALDMILSKDPAWLIDAIVGPPLAVVSESLRSCLIAGPEFELIGADYGAIEARTLAWLAREESLLGLFRSGADPYRALAGEIYGRPASEIEDPSPERSLGKMGILGAGYQMGSWRFRDSCADAGLEIDQELAQRVVRTYRESYPRIVGLWRDLENAALQAIGAPGEIVLAANGRLRFRVKDNFLWLILPSGRPLAYCEPRIEVREAPWGGERPVAAFTGMDAYTHQWCRQQAFGGRWAENVVSGAARDLLAAAMLRLEAAGYPIVLTVHDEIVAEIPIGFGSIEEFERLMCELPGWAAGCPVKAKAWRGPRYAKG
jgi:DNA polymerase bacteriophage-type